MANNVQIFTAADATGASTSYEVITEPYDSTPGTPSIVAKNGMIYVCLENTGAGTCKVHCEWSPDNQNWFVGYEYYGTSNVSNSLDRLDTGQSVTHSTGHASTGGTVDATSTQAYAFKVKGQFVRLNIAAVSGTVAVNAWIGAA